MDFVAVAVDVFTGLAFDLVPDMGRDPMLPTEEQQVGVRVFHPETVVLQLLDQIGDTKPTIVPGAPYHDFRNQKPTRVVVQPLVGTGLYLFVDAVQDRIVGLDGHDVDVLFVFEQLI